jgi:hypothetical protein
MKTDLPDTALPRFEDRLWDELGELHRQRQHQRPVAVTPHRPHRRRRPLAIGAAAAIAVAATLVIGLTVLPGGKPRPAGATVEERIVNATDAALSDSVVHVLDDFIPSSEGRDRETWYDHTTNTFRMRDLDDDGTPVFDRGPAVAPQPGDEAPDMDGFDPNDVTSADCEPAPEVGEGARMCHGWDAPEGYPTRVERTVQACDETYTEVETPFMPATLGDMEIRDRIAAGHLVADGTEVIDGRELIRLRDVATANLPDDFAVEQTVYVDPDTYLPVELHSDVGGPDENILHFDYMPRTEANLALLSPPTPEGYTEVDRLAPCA